MIIKKKYANINIKSDEAEKNVLPEIENVQADVLLNETVSPAENIDNADVSEDTDENKDEVTEEPERFSLDLSIDDIKFEQRPERREGSRRRGYRRTQDRNIVSRAQQDAQTIKETAKQDGYKEGINLAEKDIENLRTALGEFYNYKEEVFQKVSECILDISVEIAKKIIINEINKDASVLIPLIKAAVSEVNKTEEKIILRVMPKDVELVRDKMPEIFSDGAFQAKLLVVPDSNIKEGGVIIETSNGIIDATLETQLAIIEKALKTQTDERST